MHHFNYTLKPLEIERAKPRDKPYTLVDGGGLEVEILPTGGKVWRFRFRFGTSRPRFGVEGFSPHGTRGTAATLLLEHKIRKDVVELLLAHAEKDKTKAAYLHHELADERRAALQFLADRIDRAAAGAEVVALKFSA